MKRLLLDTHVVLWWLGNDPRLGARARGVIADQSNDVLVSAVVGFEIAVKRKLGKLRAPDNLADEVERSGFTVLPVSMTHGQEAGALPMYHRDPFDRLQIAQARVNDLTLVTADHACRQYDVSWLCTD